MASYIGIGLIIIGIILAIIGGILVFNYGQTPQNPVLWWMWGLLVLGIILFLIGLFVAFITYNNTVTTTEF